MLRVNKLSSTILLLVISSISVLISCSSADKKSDEAEGAYAIAQEYDAEERYEEAIRRYQEIKNKFPYSKYATMSELAMADAYFKQESFTEAQVAYQSFKDLHPKHPQIDYVTFRLALSIFKQLPPTTDRDLTLATSAILYFDELISQFPKSTHVGEAKDKRAETLKMLASKESYIAEFYFIREKYDSALVRYDGLLKKYPGLGYDAQALANAAIAAKKIGEEGRSNRYLSELEKRFPESDELKAAQKGVK